MKKALIKNIFKYINVKGLIVEWVLKEELNTILERAVNSTKTPFDNMAKASLYPVIVEETEKYIDEKIALLLAE